MIFVTVGTHSAPMTRLIDALDDLPADQLVVQHGNAPAPRRAREAAAFMPFGDMLERFAAAEVVVTHAGVGSVLCATRAGHTPLVVPRLRRHGEHVDDHQVELAEALEQSGAVVAVWDLEELPAAVASAPARRPPEEQGERPLHAAVRDELARGLAAGDRAPGAVGAGRPDQ